MRIEYPVSGLTRQHIWSIYTESISVNLTLRDRFKQSTALSIHPRIDYTYESSIIEVLEGYSKRDHFFQFQ